MDENEEPTEMTAMTGGPTHEVAGGGADSSTTVVGNGGSSNSNNYNNSSCNNNYYYCNSHSPNGTDPAPFRGAWLKKQLGSPAGKCLFLVAILGLSVLAAYLGSKVVVGAIFMHECVAEPFVPIYLVVSSSLFIIFIGILCIIFYKCRHMYEEEEAISPVYLLFLVYSFLHLVLQLAGSVCVIRTSNWFTDNEDDEEDLCNDTLLTYAFGVVIFELILSSIFFIFAIGYLCQVIYGECCKGTKSHGNASPP